MAIRSRTDFLVVHVTATPPSKDIGAAEVNAMHKAKGWSGIGYHFVIRRNGKVETGRAVNQVGAHVQGWNSVSLGVSLVGGVDEKGRPQDNRTAEQVLALKALLGELSKKYPHAKVCGHRDLSPDKDGDGVIEPHEHIKACPCFDAIPWAAQNGLPAAGIRGTWNNIAPSIHEMAAPDARNLYLQKLLARAGYAFGPIDGVVGKRTRAAIEQFQRWESMPVSGRFDDNTAATLRRKFEPAPGAA